MSLLNTKSEMREIQENPTQLHYVLICKGPSSATNTLTNIPLSLMSLLQDFGDVFPNELPPGLRSIEHRIDLIPGAPLPNRAAYRTNPTDTKEINNQIQDLLIKGYCRCVVDISRRRVSSRRGVRVGGIRRSNTGRDDTSLPSFGTRCTRAGPTAACLELSGRTSARLQ